MRPMNELAAGMFADLINDWRVYVVEPDARYAGVLYVGSYPYDAQGNPLHPEAPAIADIWNGRTAGARQISDRQKRMDVLAPPAHFEPVYQQLHA